MALKRDASLLDMIMPSAIKKINGERLAANDQPSRTADPGGARCIAGDAAVPDQGPASVP